MFHKIPCTFHYQLCSKKVSGKLYESIKKVALGGFN